MPTIHATTPSSKFRSISKHVRCGVTSCVVAAMVLCLAPSGVRAQHTTGCPDPAQSQSLDAEQRALSVRVAELEQQSREVPVLPSMIVGGIAAAATLGFAMAHDRRSGSEAFHYALATAVSGSTTLGAGITFALRRREKRAIAREIRPLNEHADSIRWVLAMGCPPTALEALRNRYQVDRELLAVDRELRTLSGAPPVLLIVPTAIASAGLLLSALWIYVHAHKEPAGGSYDSDTRRAARALFASGTILLVPLAGGAAWAIKRRQARKPLAASRQQLRLRRRALDAELAPQLGRRSLGFTLQVTF